MVTELDHPNVGTLVDNNQSKLKYLIIYLNLTAILLCFHTLFYFFRAKAGSEPIVVDNLWATKRARQNGRRKISVPSESVLNDVVPSNSVLDDVVPSNSVLDDVVQTDSVLDDVVPSDAVLDAAVQNEAEAEAVPELNLSSEEVSSEDEERLVWPRPRMTDSKKTKCMRVLSGVPTQSSGTNKRKSRA